MDLNVLNDKQKQAVISPLGPVLVLAGAGSGKTRVLTYRVAYIIEQGMFAPDRVLALTFTNKAAKEMSARVFRLLASSEQNVKRKMSLVSAPTLGTFHSVCARILRKEIPILGYSRGFVIFDTDDQLKIFREISNEMGLGKKFPPTLFRSYVSSAKNLVQSPDELDIGLDTYMHELVKQVYVRYQNYLYSQNGLDFDDLLMLAIKIFQLSPKVLDKYRELYKYILVDEYQDTNHAQYVLLRLLAEHRNLFVVGDDAQSIYGFRGSNINNILSFEKDYPDALVVKLEQNYRSTKNILAVADTVIALNPEQKPKKLWTENSPGPKIVVHEAEDESGEALFVAKKIISLSAGPGAEEVEYLENIGQEEVESPRTFSILDQFLKNQNRKSRFGFEGFVNSGVNFAHLPKEHGLLSRFAVLYRTHSQSRALEEVFINSGIPYQIVGGVKFYERKEIKDMLSYLRLVLNFTDLVSLKRVINEPARGIGEKSYQIIKEFILENAGTSKDKRLTLSDFRNLLTSITLPPKQYQAVQNFFLLIENFSLLEPKEHLFGLMRLVFKKTGLEQWLSDGTEIGQQRVENVKELFNVAAKFNHLVWREALEQFLEEVALVTEIDSLNETKDAVTLMTLHSAKGLEFDTVFFVGLEEGILPHSRSLLNPLEISEEVRLAYVGITRARKNLFMAYAKRRRSFGTLQINAPSRILRSLPEQHITANTSSFRLNDGDVYYEPI